MPFFMLGLILALYKVNAKPVICNPNQVHWPYYTESVNEQKPSQTAINTQGSAFGNTLC